MSGDFAVISNAYQQSYPQLVWISAVPLIIDYKAVICRNVRLFVAKHYNIIALYAAGLLKTLQNI